MCFIMHLQFNAEGVVPLIAQGWRGTSLPWGGDSQTKFNAVGVVPFTISVTFHESC